VVINQLGLEIIQSCTRLGQLGEISAGLRFRISQQTFIVALQEQEGLRVAADNVDQTSPALSIQRRALRCLAH
jgi:hypothetical protein